MFSGFTGNSYWKRRDTVEQDSKTVGGVQAHNIIRREGGPTTFATRRVDDTKDVFSELLGYGNMDAIVNFTLAEARRKGDDNKSHVALAQ